MGSDKRFSAEVKQHVLDIVEVTKRRTGWNRAYILRRLGVAKSRYHAWALRAKEHASCGAATTTDALDALKDRSTVSGIALDAVLPEEKQAVIDYSLLHPKDGYRRLAWQMVDEDVAFLSASSVYRILSEADLLYRWKRSTHSGAVPAKPTRPNERWHTDIMYLRVADTWYFLVTVLDAYRAGTWCTGIC